ncbi:Lysophospholipid acyltransferase [Nakaseomyces bracarensis]|uniref:Lysophospholipid acyltransferase n=1 Tax=Nakaseomyces bracarensis TaxID=273131 RepID=A0ABR4NUJ1_9SACH
MYNPIDAAIMQISSTYGIDDFMIRFAICLLGSFPLNTILKRIPDDKQRTKCIYIITMCMVYIVGVMNLLGGVRTLLISSMFTYFTTKYYKSSLMPHLVFVFVMGHLALNHSYVQFFVDKAPGQNSVDITSAQMVLAMKLTSFAWSYHDGAYTEDHKFEELSSYQKSKAIKEHPSLLRFLAYTFFYSTILTGPSFEYADFESWLNCEMFHDLPNDDPVVKECKEKKRTIPKNGKLAGRKVIEGLFWIVLSTLGPKYFPVTYITEDSAFMQRSFFYRIHYMSILGFIARLKYYAAWTIAEGACILCGLGYNGYDPVTKKMKWNRVQNIDVYHVEFAQSTKESLDSWNMNTNKWLKYYIYLRVAKKGQKPGFRSTLFTFLTSAFWHGTRPGYYLTFATGALYQTCGKFYRRNLRPIFMSADGKTPMATKKIYDFICFYVIKLAFGYLVIPFIVLDLKSSFFAWKTVYFYGHIIVALTFFLFAGPYAKKVVKFCRKFQPVAIEEKEQRQVAEQMVEKSGSLGDILKDKLSYEQSRQKSEEPDIALGIPTIDVEKPQWSTAKNEWDQFYKEYVEWRDQKGLEIEEENLAKAFSKFKEEIMGSKSEPSQKGNRVRKMSFSAYSSESLSLPEVKKE